jgi:hypothetical protein
MEQISGFPKNLSYNLKRLQGSLIKQKIRINADKSLYNANERVMFNFPIGRMIDSRSIVMTAKCTANTAGNHFPRGGLNSLIENLQITANSKVLQSTQYYNFVWNTIADLSGYFSADQLPKRILYENGDPSISHTNTQGEGDPATSSACFDNTGTDSYYFCVNNWLGFLSSSASTWDTNNLGQIQMTITLAPNGCLWLGASSAATSVTATAGTYKVEEATLSMDCITFTNSLYYDLVKSQLEGNGLNIAYNDYLVSVGALVAKSATGITHTAQFSTNSLDSCIATFRPTGFDTNTTLYLSKQAQNNGTGVFTYYEVVSNPLANEGTYGGFNNSKYFVRDGGGIDYSSWYINSQPMTANSTPIEIYNNTLQALDYANVDLLGSSIHPGALTSGFYNKYYFADILSLENHSGDGNNWVSGLGGNGGVIQVQYNARFKTITNNTYPVIIGKVSKILNIKIGRNLDLME